MAFTAPLFWIFLVVVLAVFALLAQRWRAAWLGLASVVFYGSFGWLNLVWLGFVVGVAALSSALARRGKAGPVLGVIALAAALAAVKSGVLTAPPGYSFYSFAAIAWLADLWRQSAVTGQDGSLLSGWPAVLGLVWFPKLLAGPITRTADMAGQITRGLRATPLGVHIGAVLILGGLIKKLVIADNLALVVDPAYAIAAYAAPMELLIASYFFAFQIYCDFSGYTDLALGLSLLFGLHLPANFAKPYLMPSVGQFWSQGWHITLGRWFRDYVYIPLGGSRAGRGRRMLNLMIVFLLSGLWHSGLGYGAGWGFLIWGLLNGLFVSVEGVLPSAPQGRVIRVLQVILTFHLILLTWVFFRAATLEDALTILRRLWNALPDLPGLVGAYPFTTGHGVGAALIAGLLLAEVATGAAPVHQRLLALPRPLRWGLIYAGITLLLVLGRWQGAGFIYLQF